MKMDRFARIFDRLRLAQVAPNARRRTLIRAAACLAATAVTVPVLPRGAAAQPRFASYPFTLGVASGSPRADSIVLWTRLAPEPLVGGGLAPEPIDLRWEIARDERFTSVVARGTARAMPELAHSVRVEATGLEPARWYWYRFIAGDAVSAPARTRTAPAPGTPADRLTLAFASCQQYEQGYYTAYHHMAREDLDLVVFLGDYIYEASWGRNHVRKHATAEPYTLDDYRVRHAQYKSDLDLRAMHAQAPWLVTWDDHEVQNDYANDRSQDLDPNFLQRRTAAYQAYFEHMPLPLSALPQGPALRLYDRYAFGDLLQIHVLDDRQYRTHQACAAQGRGGSNRVQEACTERVEPQRTILGVEQEQWLDQGLAGSRTRWNLLAQQTVMAQLGRVTPTGRSYWTDGWDGYPEARRRLLGAVAKHQPGNTVVIGGDVHCHWVSDLKADFDDPQSATVATEFCGTSITSQGPAIKQTMATMQENPHVRYALGTKRGYVKLQFRRQTVTATLRGLDSEKRPDSGISTLATFAVEHGRPGAQQT
jgi:alkaline phosphatase D